MLHTPGHSPGSISTLFQNGDAIIGDILRVLAAALQNLSNAAPRKRRKQRPTE